MGKPMAEAEIGAYDTAAHQLLDMEVLAFERDPDELEVMYINEILGPLVKILEKYDRDTVALQWLIAKIREMR